MIMQKNITSTRTSMDSIYLTAARDAPVKKVGITLVLAQKHIHDLVKVNKRYG